MCLVKALCLFQIKRLLQMHADGIEALAGCPLLEQIDLGRDPVLTPGNTDTLFDSKVSFTFKRSLECREWN